MRQISLKRQKLNREVKPWRDALCARVGRCEVCLKSKAPEYLDVDEIARGNGVRGKSLACEFAVLVVCRPCHNRVQNWNRAKRLALLYLARSTDYHLDKYHKLIQRVKPDQDEVDVYITALVEERSSNAGHSFR